MKVEEIKIKLIDRIKRELEAPISIPLDSIASAMLMVNVSPPEGECDLTLKNPTCINEATVPGMGILFNYHQKTVNFTSKGLLVAYCAEINSRDKTIPVAGGPSPPIPEDVDVSLVLSSSIVKALVTDVGKESSVKSKEGEIKLKMISYKLDNERAQLNIHSDVKENGVKTATITSLVDLSHGSVISNGYLLGNVSLLSAEHKIEPPDNEVAKEMGKRMVSRLVSKANEHLRRMNVPFGPEIKLLNKAPVQVDSQGHLVASK
uniref:Vomeromodulin-like isoform X2 n=1 Tax=Phascolarctos cinereus TaxID=38626 RepID=A0A6P5KN88_PHACI|nr:vomeromodulin-like isoform X2 [Phascolarctos cinereus]